MAKFNTATCRLKRCIDLLVKYLLVPWHQTNEKERQHVLHKPSRIIFIKYEHPINSNVRALALGHMRLLALT